MILERMAARMVAAEETLRLFRNPGHAAMSVEDILSELRSGEYEGRYFTLDPDSAIGYHPTGQMIEVEVPVKDLAIDNLHLAWALIEKYFNRDRTYDQDDIEEALGLGIPRSTVKRITDYIDNFDSLIEASESAKTDVTTRDGVLSPEMVDALEEAFRHIDQDAFVESGGGQVQMARRGLQETELIAVYSYDDDFMITEVSEVSGSPTLSVGDSKPGLPRPT